MAWGGVVVVFIADYILRPRLVGTRIKMNDLLVFIAIFGGIEAFGALGIVLGPIAVAILLALLRIYQRDYRPEGPVRTPDVTAPDHEEEHAAQHDARDARAGPRGVDIRDEWHADEREQADDADAQLEARVDAQRMLARRNKKREGEAAEAHAAHERAEQHAQRNR